MDDNKNIFELPTETVKSVLKSILKEEFHLRQYTLEVIPGSEKGDNYLGIVYRINIIKSDPPLKDNTGFIIKMSPMHPQRREQFFARPSFLREILVYENIIPLFMKFQKQKGIDIFAEGFHHIPKCYKCISEEFTEALIMEDLKLRDFKMYNRCQEMSYEHTLVAVEALAKFHAVSFAIKDQCFKDERYQKCVNLTDMWIERREDKMMQEYQKGLSKRALSTLDPEKDKDIFQKVEKVLMQPYMDNLEKVVTGSLAEPYSIVCHGDFWNNNILYRYEDGKPTEAYLLDYQIVRYASPATDLVYYMFTCTSGEFRKKHMDDILNAYYKHFSQLTRKLGSNPDIIFPENILKQHIKQFGMFGVLMAVLLLPIFVAPPEEAPDMEETAEKLADGQDVASNPEKTASQKTMEQYAQRMRDVLRDACSYDIISSCDD